MPGCEPCTWTVGQIVNALINKEDNGIPIIVPRFQRGKAWDEKKQHELIDSLEMGYPVGSLLFYKSVNESKTYYLLVDGLQRSNTIRKYICTPTEFVSINSIPENILMDILKVLGFEDNDNIKELIKEHIINYVKSVGSFQELKGQKVIYNILKEEVIGERYKNDDYLEILNELCDCVEPYFEELRSKYSTIQDTKLPVVVYDGDIRNLREIFDRINTKGEPLNQYEVYAAAWPDNPKLKVDNFNLIRRVTDKYDALKDDGIKVEGYSYEEMCKSKELTVFEYVFGLSKELDENYKILNFNTKLAVDEIDSLGFELLNACLNDNSKDIAMLYKKILNIDDINLFEKCLKESVEYVTDTIYRITAFKGNKTNVTKSFFRPHGKYQIISLISFTFREMYDINDLNDYKKTWAVNNPILKRNMLQYYIYDIIEKNWNDGAVGKVYAANRSKKYLQNITLPLWESALNSYFERTSSKNETINIQNPKPEDITILNCIYAKQFTALDHLSDATFDIEHLATKKRMKQLIQMTESEGLPISSIGNICYLPSGINRSKKNKTLYQEKNSIKGMEDIESRFSFTKESDLKWIENDYNKDGREEFEKEYRIFIKKRFRVQKQKFYESLEIKFSEDNINEVSKDSEINIEANKKDVGSHNKRLKIERVGGYIGDPRPQNKVKKPELPAVNNNEGAPRYVKAALINLIESGYVFSTEQMKECGKVSDGRSYTALTRSTKYPLFWKLNPGESKESLEDDAAKRYFPTVFCDGIHEFLVNSQWYKDTSGKTPHLKDFIKWYNEL